MSDPPGASAAAAAASSGENANGEWCTIESDPAVFTEMLESLGCESVELEELYSLDDSELQRLTTSLPSAAAVDAPTKPPQPRGVYGLIFLFQWLSKEQQEQEGRTLSTNREPLSEDSIPPGLFFAHQVTTNACATQAILSVVLNAAPLNDAQLGPVLTEFKQFTEQFPSNLKGVAISSSDDLRKAHNAFAKPDLFYSPEKRVVAADKDHEAFHFIAYIPGKDAGGETVVYELDGLQKGPIVIGTVPKEEQGEETGGALPWMQLARTAIQERMQAAGASNIKFNLMAVLQDARIPLQDALQDLNPEQDMALAAEINTALQAEHAKRETWRLQNQRRRHNYLPLCMQMLREWARMGMLPQLIADAKERQAQKRRAAAMKKEASKM